MTNEPDESGRLVTDPVHTIRLSAFETGQACSAFLEQYLDHGGNDRALLRADLQVEFDGAGLAYTADPASWGDWLRGVWALRNISPRGRVSTQSDVEVSLATGEVAFATVRALVPSRFESTSAAHELGNSIQNTATYSESTAYALLESYVGWSGFSEGLTIVGLIENLRSLQSGTASAALENTWAELLGK